MRDGKKLSDRKMQIRSVYLIKEDLAYLDECDRYVSVSEAIRRAIRDLIQKERELDKLMEKKG